MTSGRNHLRDYARAPKRRRLWWRPGVEREGAASLMLAAQTPMKPGGGVKGKTSAELMEKLAQQSDKAAATTVETMGAKTGAAFGIGNSIKSAADEEAAAQAKINAIAGGADKAAALKAHGDAMAAAAPAPERV